MGVESGTFSYANPGQIYWGAGCVAARLDGELQRLGVDRAFVVTTRSVAANSALFGALRTQLGPRFVGSFSGISQHAPASTVAAAVAEARSVRPDVLISFGGGSPIDAAKAV